MDYLKLPSVTKLSTGGYRARSLSMEFAALRDLRAALLLEAAQAYAPDVFLVDHAPLGLQGEALPALRSLRSSHPGCLCVLGLRDILDERQVVRRAWAAEGIYPILERVFDLILVYGSQAVFDVATEYALPPAVLRRVRYCGYLDHLSPAAASEEPASTSWRMAKHDAAGRQLVVLTVGGGGDGFPLLHTYLEGLAGRTDSSIASVLLTGPLMDAGELYALRKLVDQLPPGTVRIEQFLANPLPLFRAADLVVTMAGYNSVCELLALRQRILFIPRVAPRQEQLLRARLLARRGLAQVLHPSGLRPQTLVDRVLEGLAQPRPVLQQLATAGITFSGQQQALRAITEELDALPGRRRNEEEAGDPAVLRRMV